MYSTYMLKPPRVLSSAVCVPMLLVLPLHAVEPATELLYYDGLDAQGKLVGGVVTVPLPTLMHENLAGRGGSELIWGSGDSSNRIDITIVGDGYHHLAAQAARWHRSRPGSDRK